MDKDSHEKITPTADLISFYRSFSDTPFASEIASILSSESLARDMLKENFKNSFWLAVMSEARYKRIDVHARGYSNILEVGIGRSPRDLIFTENPNINYVATDLPDSLKQHEALITELMRRHNLQRTNLKFASVNALNSDELNKAANMLPPGPAAVISEGFMVYLHNGEKTQFLNNVHTILFKRGGVLITSDVIIAENRQVGSGILNSISQSTGRDMRDYSFSSIQEAKDFFDGVGFLTETFLDDVEVTTVKKLHLEDNPDSQRALRFPVWVLSPKENIVIHRVG